MPKTTLSTKAPHASVEMEQVPRSYHYHTKSYSYLFRCPSCGWEKRQNTNYLGRRKMVCNGIFSGPSVALTTTA